MRRRIEATSHYVCGACGERGHNRATCPKEKRRAPRHCRLCSDLPHRRRTIRVRDDGVVVEDPSATSCAACGLPYMPETVTLADVLRMPSEDRSVEHV